MNVHAKRSTPPWYVVLLATAAVGIIIFAITQLGAPAVSFARTSIEDVTAENGVVQATVTAGGAVEPGVNDTLNFGTSGTLRSVDVRVGQHVKKGQLIATLDPAPAQLTLAEDEASLAVAQSNLTALEDGSSTAPSAGSTAGGATGSAAAAGNATKPSAPRASSGAVAAVPTAAQIQQAQVQVEAAQATVNADQQALAETTLYAPATGMIASLAGYSIGQAIAGSSSAAAARTATSAASRGAASTAAGASGSGSGFAQLINDSTMTMTVALSENSISSVRVGQPANVAISALSGVELAGRVSSISPLGSDSSGVVTYNATITVSQSNPKVLPGMSATATIVTSQAQGVTLPSDAITGSGNAATVHVVKGGKVMATPVVVGLRGGSRTQIISGLTSGQEVQIKITLPALGTTTTSTSSLGPAGGLGRLGRRGVGAKLRALLGGAAG